MIYRAINHHQNSNINNTIKKLFEKFKTPRTSKVSEIKNYKLNAFQKKPVRQNIKYQISLLHAIFTKTLKCIHNQRKKIPKTFQQPYKLFIQKRKSTLTIICSNVLIFTIYKYIQHTISTYNKLMYISPYRQERQNLYFSVFFITFQVAYTRYNVTDETLCIMLGLTFMLFIVVRFFYERASLSPKNK